MKAYWKPLAILGAAFFGLATAASSASADPVNIRIAWAQMPGHMIPVLFSNKSILKHYGTSYTVTPVLFRGSTPQITALAAKELDMAAFSPPALALSVTNAHLQPRVVADIIEDGIPGYHSDTFMVKADGPIKTIADLKGKRIGTNAIGSSMDTAMRVITANAGLQDHRDFSVVEAAFSSMPAMLEQSKVDCGPILQPFSDDLAKAGKLRVLFTTAQAVGPSQVVFLAARADFLAAHPAAMHDFFEDYIRAFRWFMDPKNKQAAVKIIADFMKQPPENFSYLFTKADYYRDPYMVPNVKYIQSAIDAALQAGALKQDMTVAPKYVDLSWINDAKKRVQANP
ncbi:MAG TPA: ABC transporter substrate-binding protein [Stellaceae bacterium]|jgi:NitT/TauT family transport system substrate-binding protein|nr:ABC transporter substrate-binding protein [Stellaceae bacterium]